MDCKDCPFYAPVKRSLATGWTHICLLVPDFGENFEDCGCGYPCGHLGPEKFDDLRAELIGALICAADRLRDAKYDTREL